ncbi:tyrosine-type recombinase/integrase [Desulfobacula sp.]|uniref:tyrosine-type recombinase/integrase n=1 Tax=Desulfobacula sp. TaxID=2593537 RepID=UPI00260E3769|nr:tyrosine-type recombinase/integrase [Desulfobacula sp.]
MTNRNQNHPVKGSIIAVEPIRKIKDVNLIKTMLKDKPRDYALFITGINTNLRASDILNIKVHQVHGAKPGDELTLNEIKTKKPRRITLNRATIAAIQPLLKQMQANGALELEGPLFRGQRGNGLTVPSLSRLVKKWCQDANLKGNYASHTLRKTWGYHQRVTFGVGLPELMVCFNHSSQRQTLDYLCIQPEEIKSVYENEL